MYLYTNEFHGHYAAGLIVVAARNAFRAMEIIKEYPHGPEYPEYNLEQIVGATYEGEEKVIKQVVYYE
jgi:hypothetical protein